MEKSAPIKLKIRNFVMIELHQKLKAISFFAASFRAAGGVSRLIKKSKKSLFFIKLIP